MAITVSTDTHGTVELPRLTLRLARLQHKPQEAAEQEAGWRAEWDFLVEVLGDEVVADECGAAKVSEADVTALDVLYARVRAAYEAPVIAAQRERIQASLGVLEDVDADRLERITDATSRATGRQGFGRVR